MNDDKKGQLISYIKAVLVNNNLPEDTKYEDLPEDLKPQIMKARAGLTTVSKTNLELAEKRTITISLDEYNSLKKVANSAGLEVKSDGSINNIVSLNEASSSKSGGKQLVKSDGHFNSYEDQRKTAA